MPLRAALPVRQSLFALGFMMVSSVALAAGTGQPGQASSPAAHADLAESLAFDPSFVTAGPSQPATEIPFRFKSSTEEAMRVLSARGQTFYLGEFDGIDGFLFLASQGSGADVRTVKKTVYVSPNGQYMIDGYMMDADNRNITRLQLLGLSGGPLVSDADTKNGKEQIVQSILDYKTYFDLGFLDDLRTIAFTYTAPGTDHNRFNTIYLPANGKSVIVGTAFDLQGNNETRQQISKLIGGDMFAPAATPQAAPSYASAPGAEAELPILSNTYHAQPSNSQEENPEAVTEAQNAIDALLSGKPAISSASVTGQDNIADTASDQAAKLLAAKFEALSHMANFTVGSTSSHIPEINIIIDPECAYCKSLWKQIKPFIDNDLLRLNVAMAAFRTDKSIDLSTTILEAEDPAAVLRQVMEGTLPPSDVKALTEKARIALRQTHIVMDKYDMKLSPVLAYVDRHGQRMIMEGAPKDMKAFMSELYDPEVLVKELQKKAQ